MHSPDAGSHKKEQPIDSMIKKISVDQLRVGMFVHNLDCEWMDHPFFRRRFPVKNDRVIEKIAQSGIKYLYIDACKGQDGDAAPRAAEALLDVQHQLEGTLEPASGLTKQVAVAQEMQNARAVFKQAQSVITNLMGDVRLGKQVEVESVEPIVEEMISSAFRNKDALISLSRIKNKDEYTFMHSVSVAGLLIAFGRALDVDRETIKELAVGGLLHDIGKMLVPLEILNKPGRLDPDEFEMMRTHVVHSREILQTTPGITKHALDVAALHHERFDGTGYPDGLKSDAISTFGQMSAIVDVYDALTSVRVYKDAWEPAFTLKKNV